MFIIIYIIICCEKNYLKKKSIVLLKKVFENTENTNTKRFEKFSLNK